ncbi:hypothetical protein HOY34_19210 [Xinfangfangia sp. D13-10-4-6]|uniref:hypothetical protein n=1 Tax=Pseudogemmobacter hezensis TaxID=2737662 RepID=UPI001557A86F|nr:hypothetical protein [Pseudogemmobacter hezensis]NPD17318.1 hypothetical protein [Pseudogemmobacter hezensis]
MANANAEAQRRWRQRQKEKRQAGLTEASTPSDVFRTPFFEFYANNPYESEFNFCLDMAGIPMPEFEDDRGPAHHALNEVLDAGSPSFSDEVRSLGRAEVMVGALIDAARSLADMVNNYKQREITARMAEIEASDLSEPEAKKAALKEAARLQKMLDQLDKQVRWTFPQWKVTG